MGLFESFKRRGGTKTKRARAGKRRPPAAPAPAPSADGPGSETAVAADDAIQTLKELEELVVTSGAPHSPAEKPKRGLAALFARPAKAEPRPPVEAEPRAAAAADRSDLIRDALAVRRAKQEVLGELSPQHRALLRAMANKLLIGRGPGG